MATVKTKWFSALRRRVELRAPRDRKSIDRKSGDSIDVSEDSSRQGPLHMPVWYFYYKCFAEQIDKVG